MNDLISTVDWSRAQFAMTAMYHWLFVPLTIGLALIVAVMESIYVRTGSEAWKRLTKFWMTLFGINFACGVATGLILEFEFGTNWSNYSWFVGDIFGAPLAIEGLFAFFMEATFVAVMFFGWDKVSRRFHLAATWLTALGVTLSALWILVANAWMQSPVGMDFNPAAMRNEMTDFWAVALNPVAINKFLHAVFSGWALGAVFVLGVSCWLLYRGRSYRASIRSIKVAAWVGAAGILCTLWTGHGSAAEVSRCQPMKLAAMEGLWNGAPSQELICFGIYDDDAARRGDDPVKFKIALPGGLAFLANGDASSFVPGINDIIAGVTLDANGDTVNTVSYADRIAAGQRVRVALNDYDAARKTDNKEAIEDALERIRDDYRFFGYGFLDSPAQAIPPVALTFYSFRAMVILGLYLILVIGVALWLVYRRPGALRNKVLCWLGMLSIPAVWVCSQAGWVVAEVGRQPWVIQDLMPTGVAISAIPSSSVQLTFWIFAAIFTLLLVAEISIMLRQISLKSKDLDKE